MKWQNHFFALASILFYLPAFGQMITGRVVTTTATPIADASVSLRVKGVSTTTNSLGQFTLDLSSGISRSRTAAVAPGAIHFNGKALVFAISIPEKVRIDLYDISGKRLHRIPDQTYEAGSHVLPISVLMAGKFGTGIYIVKIIKGTEVAILVLTAIGGQNVLMADNKRSTTIDIRASSKKTGVVEVLIASKPTYNSRTLDIGSYSTQNIGDIVLTSTATDSAAIERKVDSLLVLMNNAQKAGQMVQVMNTTITPADVTTYGFGSIFNGGEEPVSPNTPANWATRLDALQGGAMASSLKIPMIYGLDAVHGNGKVVGSTIFPHNIGLGCTHDTALIEQVGRITASECAAVGIHLAFAPCIAVVRNERWGRTYEGFGETPEINSQMGAAFIRGLQGNGDMSKNSAIAACAKHYLGDGGTDNGTNGGTTTLTEASMRGIHFPPYIACAREKMASIMPSYSSWSRNGQTIKQTIDSASLTRMLKHELNWDGFIITDYDAIPQALTGGYSVANVGIAVMAGIDMAMIPSRSNALQFISSIQQAVTNGNLSQARLDDAVRRILRIKFRMHLWDHSNSQPALISMIGNADHRSVARECVRKSLVALKNSNAALPIKRTERIAVVGPWANNMGAQCGGWTIGWQGSTSYTSASVGGGQTILQGLQQLGGSNVVSDEQGNNLSTADKIVVVVGENPYAEGQGDVASPDFTNCPNSSLIQKCFNSGKPVILVMITGRPMLIDTEINWCSAIVAAWLPGTEGLGVADVLYGDYNFSGTLTHTWAATAGQIPINAGTVYADDPKGSGGVPLFSYGFGLTY